ncbi:GNAT family N-acetyltransferase [Fulvivirga sp. M361]|uniref:GNAT family N-acetyltransferase n=1 Tax=Fulvivirga sp. M361 TaxID=2594266 RepID=UPI00117BD833|nr:GNAT family N-acetyltransferase [Fulvivirga sp. M361]TRX60662.1 GNAT family N-acetyltransferase [Fulvivirga sp. M361]
MFIKEIPYQLTWEVRHKVMWPNEPFDYVKLKEDEFGRHLGLFVADELTSIISLFVEDENVQFRKFATLSSEQGKGYGTILLKHVLSELIGTAVKRVWCNARTDKILFYERFGMTKTNIKFIRGGMDYVVMEKLV